MAMAVDLHPPDPRLGAWRATHQTDRIVVRHLALARIGVVVALCLALVGFALLATPYPIVGVVLLGLALIGGMSTLASQPRAKTMIPLWSLAAFLRGRVRIDLYAEGFALTDRKGRRVYPWDTIRTVRHPLFRHGNWSRDEDAATWTQQATRLIVCLPARGRLVIDDMLSHFRELAEEIQQAVYGRLLRQAEKEYEAGKVVWFGPVGISQHALFSAEGPLAWREVAALELKGTRLRVVRAGWPATFHTADASDMPNFPVFMALLERDQPDRARDLIEGLPLDSAAQIWQRASRLRERYVGRAAGISASISISCNETTAAMLDDVPDHSGRSFRADADLFAPPPSEIGMIISAGTSLSRGQRPYKLVQRVLLCLAAGLSLMLPGIGLLVLSNWRHPFWLGFCFFLLPSVAVILVWIYTRFVHQVTYVGLRGLARRTCRGGRDHLVETAILLFEHADAVHTSLKHRYTKNGYQGSDYDYRWSGLGGGKLFRISGTYHSEKEPPPPQDSFHFGESADVAWSLHLLDQYQERLNGDGVEFYLEDRDSIRVSPGKLRFRLDGQQTECSIEDLEETSLKGGILKLQRHDAQIGWFSSTGVYEVELSELGNARLFLFLLRTVVAFGSTHATDHWKPSNSLESMEQVVSKLWQADERSSSMVGKLLPLEARKSGEEHLQGVRIAGS